MRKLCLVWVWLVPPLAATPIVVYNSPGQAALATANMTAGTDFEQVNCAYSYYCAAGGAGFAGYLNEGQHADIYVSNFDGLTGSGNALRGPAYNDGRSFLQLRLPEAAASGFSLEVFGIDGVTGESVSTPVTVKFYRGATLVDTVTLTAGKGSPIFLGMIADLGITEVRLYAGRAGAVLLVDNFRYSDRPARPSESMAAPVPEIRSWMSALAGFGLLAAIWRRRATAARFSAG